MIFLAVGTQLRFDRLAEAVDTWCASHPGVEVFGQLGPVGDTGYQPCNYEWVESVSQAEFEKMLVASEYVVAHAGIGTILSALLNQKPVLLMPRCADLEEHRNDHQLATASRFAETKGVFVVHSAANLYDKMDYLCSTVVSTAPLKEFSEGSLVEYLRRVLSDKT